MCFDISKYYPSEMVAEQPMWCYKEMMALPFGLRKSLHQDTFWFLSRKKAKFGIALANRYTDDYEIREGLHSYPHQRYGIATYDGNTQCVIPKGAKYYFNGYEYVSTDLILVSGAYNRFINKVLFWRQKHIKSAIHAKHEPKKLTIQEILKG